jgi:hypothetical protein
MLLTSRLIYALLMMGQGTGGGTIVNAEAALSGSGVLYFQYVPNVGLTCILEVCCSWWPESHTLNLCHATLSEGWMLNAHPAVWV